jgi:hypothetical protein
VRAQDLCERSERTLNGPRAAPFLAQRHRNRVAETKLVRRRTLEPTATKGRRPGTPGMGLVLGIGVTWHRQNVSFNWRYFENFAANYV